jgi:hypothetical protein
MAKKDQAPKPETNEKNGAVPMPTQRRVNRGSRRRIDNARQNFYKAFDEFIKEMDAQFYDADEEGNRAGPWAFVEELKGVKTGIERVIDAALTDNTAKAEERIAERRARDPGRTSKTPGNNGAGTTADDPSKNE